MRTKIIFTIITTTLMLSGCATQPPKVWSKPGASQEDFRRDSLTCRQYGMQSAMANGLGGNMFVEMWIRDKANECLAELGWS